MLSPRARLALAILAASVVAGPEVAFAESPPNGQPRIEGFVQPFIIHFRRHESQVIAFLADHPTYEAVEAMVTMRDGQPPLIRAILTLHDQSQVDHVNDREFVRERAALLPARRIVYRTIEYEESQIDGVPRVRLRFTSYQGEEIVLDFQALFPPSTEQGGLIDPGDHARTESLPVLWANASTVSSNETRVTIDGILYAIPPGPLPDSRFAFYSQGFLIGIVSEGQLALWQISHPRRFAVGEQWLYWDNLGNLHRYEIIGIAGDQITIHKTTTSSVLSEEVIQTQVVDGRLRLRSVRVTGRLGDHDDVPPAPEGFTLDLSEPGRFSLSIDGHEDLVTGTASFQEGPFTTTWTLNPTQPEWTTDRSVRTTVSRIWNWSVISSEVTSEDEMPAQSLSPRPSIRPGH